MSRYIPQASVLREWNMQQIRRQHCLKAGTHVLYPDPEKGPYILKKEVADELTLKTAADTVAAALEEAKT